MADFLVVFVFMKKILEQHHVDKEVWEGETCCKPIAVNMVQWQLNKNKIAEPLYQDQ